MKPHYQILSDPNGLNRLTPERRIELSQAYQRMAESPDGALVLGDLLEVTSIRSSGVVMKSDGSVCPLVQMYHTGRREIGFYVQALLEMDLYAESDKINRRQAQDET